MIKYPCCGCLFHLMSSISHAAVISLVQCFAFLYDLTQPNIEDDYNVQKIAVKYSVDFGFCRRYKTD